MGAARNTYESNLVSMLLSAAFQGPYKTAEHQAAVLGILAEGLYNNPNAHAGPTNCHLAPLATANLSFFDQVFPLQSSRMRAAIAGCSTAPNSSTTSSVTQEAAKPTVEELLKSAERAQSDEQKSDTLVAASDLAARQENFDEAIRILDSVSLQLETNSITRQYRMPSVGGSISACSPAHSLSRS